MRHPTKITILGAWIGITRKILKFAYYRNYCADYNQILHSDKDHQILIVCGPNMRKINSRWRTAAILRNWKSAISPELFDRCSRNLAWWRILGHRSWNFQLLKIQDCGRTPSWKSKIGHISGKVWPIFAKFGTMTHKKPIKHWNCVINELRLQKNSCQIRGNAYTRTTIVRFRSFLVYILYGFLYTEGANSWGQVLVCCMHLS